MRQRVDLPGTEEVQHCPIHHVSLLLHFLKECHYLLWRCTAEKKKKISPGAIKYDRGRSEDEFEKVIAAYLRVWAATHEAFCAFFMHALCLLLYLTPHTQTAGHHEQIHKGGQNCIRRFFFYLKYTHIPESKKKAERWSIGHIWKSSTCLKLNNLSANN